MLTIKRTNPWSAIERFMNQPLGLNAELNRVLGPAIVNRQDSDSWPQLNLWQNEDELVVTAEIPGIAADQIDVDVNNNQLTISAVLPADQPSKSDSYQRRERYAGSFKRSLRLPFAVDQNKAEANYTEGVLEIRLPKADSEKPRKLVVNAG